MRTSAPVYSGIDTDFEDSVNLQNLVLSDSKPMRLLKVIIDRYYWDRSQGEGYFLRPIYIESRQSCSSIARAINNSIGNLHFNEYDCAFLSNGLNVGDIFENTNEHTTIHLKNIEALPSYYVYTLFKIVKDRIVKIPAIPPFEGAKKIRFDGMLLLSNHKEWIYLNLFKQYLEAILYIKEPDSHTLYSVLQQRIKLYRIEITEQKKVLDAIVQVCCCDIGMAIHLLSQAYYVARAVGRREITLKDFNTCLQLMA